MKVLSILAVLLILGASSAAEAIDVPFNEPGGIVRAVDESTALTAVERANLTETRLQPAVVRATVVTCNARAFQSTSVAVHLPSVRTVALTMTRREVVQDALAGTMTTWIGKTDRGGDALFSFGSGGLSGLLDEAGQKFELRQINERLCIVIQDDPLKFPRDD
jgi:hypothetical protein